MSEVCIQYGCHGDNGSKSCASKLLICFSDGLYHQLNIILYSLCLSVYSFSVWVHKVGRNMLLPTCIFCETIAGRCHERVLHPWSPTGWQESPRECESEQQQKDSQLCVCYTLWLFEKVGFQFLFLTLHGKKPENLWWQITCGSLFLSFHCSNNLFVFIIYLINPISQPYSVAAVQFK